MAWDPKKPVLDDPDSDEEQEQTLIWSPGTPRPRGQAVGSRTVPMAAVQAPPPQQRPLRQASQPPPTGFAPMQSGYPPVANYPAQGAYPQGQPYPLPSPSSPPQQAGSNAINALIVIGAFMIVVVLGVGIGIFFLRPKTGTLRVEISSEDGSSVSTAQVFIDGQKRCDAAPCVVTELLPGAKTVKVIATDFYPYDLTSEPIVAGKDRTARIVLRPVKKDILTGVRIAGAQPGVRVFVDNADRGPLPAYLKDLTPGGHTLRFEGGSSYEPLEQVVDVPAGQLQDLGTIRLRVLRGRVTLDLVTVGTEVSLMKGGQLDRRLRGPWPMTLDLENAGYTMSASKPGFEPFTRALTFDSGQPEMSVRIELTQKIKPESIAGRPTPPTPTEPPEPPPQIADAMGTLNMNSIPATKVLLDGRALGNTPKAGVSVPAGMHTVTFVHPERGKKSVTVDVKAGQTATASVSFR